MHIRILVALAIAVMIFGCKKSDPITPNPPNPPGQQQEVAWPSLANSPWPMHRGNPQLTSRSRFAGPRAGATAWQFDSIYCETGATVGVDSTIFFGGRIQRDGCYLFAVLPDGALKWKFQTPAGIPAQVTPLVAASGMVFTAAGKTVYAVDSAGKKAWEFVADGYTNEGGITIGLDGTIYFSTQNPTIFALKQNGQVAWTLSDPRVGWAPPVMSFSPDGSHSISPGHITHSLQLTWQDDRSSGPTEISHSV